MARTNPFLAAELLDRDRRAQLALSGDIKKEGVKEEQLEDKRDRDSRRRDRRSALARGVVRMAGGVGGFLLGGGLAGASVGATLGASAGSVVGHDAGRLLRDG